MTDFPLTPGEAIVLATFLEDHAKLPHLVALADRLRTWARANLTPAADAPTQTWEQPPAGGRPEIGRPSHVGENGPEPFVPEQPPTDRAWLETEFIRETCGWPPCSECSDDEDES